MTRVVVAACMSLCRHQNPLILTKHVKCCSSWACSNYIIFRSLRYLDHLRFFFWWKINHEHLGKHVSMDKSSIFLSPSMSFLEGEGKNLPTFLKSLILKKLSVKWRLISRPASWTSNLTTLGVWEDWQLRGCFKGKKSWLANLPPPG